MLKKNEFHGTRAGITHLALAGYLFCVMCAGSAVAQQAPDAPGAKSQPATGTQAPPLQPRPDFTGSWRLNLDHSDNSGAKLREFEQETDRGSYGPRPMGYPRYPGAVGIGLGGPMIGGPMGRPPMGMPPLSRPNYEDMMRMRKLIEAPDQVTIKHKDQEIDMVDGEDRVRALVTEDRKLEKPKKNSPRTEVKAHWSQSSLVSEEKGPDGTKIAKTYEISDDKKQMYEKVTINGKRLDSPITIRYRYDKAKTSTQEPTLQR